MTTFDRYAIVFILAFTLSNITWGVRKVYDAQETAAVIRELKKDVVEAKEDKDCWKRKAQEASLGYRDRRC